MARNKDLYDAVLTGRRRNVQQIVQQTIDDGKDLLELVNDSMVPAMQEVGERFSRGEAFIPEMLVSARAMQAGMSLIEPHLLAGQRVSLGTVCIGAVKGDLHDIGKNLVVIMLKSAGFEVIDLGTDCPVDKFREAVDKQGARIVCASALLSTTMNYMRDVVDAFRDRADVRVVIGGAPVTEDFAREIGAHGYGRDASDAVRVVKALVGAA
jgi:5-methyltetrahydrofolate--homocysteine methyltransferase